MDFPMKSSKCLSSATFSSSAPLPGNNASISDRIAIDIARWGVPLPKYPVPVLDLLVPNPEVI